MKIPRQARHEAKRLLRACRTNGLLEDAKVRQAVQLVLAAKPRGYVRILSHFERLVKLDLDRRSARIESAVALTPAQQGALQASLARRYGPGLNVAFALNAGLLGGVRIKVGSDVFDDSVQARLHALEESL